MDQGWLDFLNGVLIDQNGLSYLIH